MNRILGLFAATGLVLSACGGGSIQSPDFTPVLQGIDITYPGASNTSTATVAPGSTLQLTALGLYSTPPGTTSANAGAQVVSCPTAGNASAVCTLGAVSGVSWSVDPVNNSTGPIASIDNSGNASGLRRGTAVVRAKTGGFETTETLKVSGTVLSEVTIGASPSTSVPTGRSITLTATPKCTNDAGTTVSCVRTDYVFSWALSSTFPAETVEFTPSSAQGKTVIAKTKRFGDFVIEVSVTNEEGTVLMTPQALTATERVLDDVIVSADPVQSTPVPIIVGTKTRFVARGLFSDGAIADIRSQDVNGALTWTQDASSVGAITIENQTDANGVVSPNAAVLVSGDQVGATGLNVNGRNTETTGVNGPNGLLLSDRIALEVKTFGLLGLADICPFDAIGSTCPQNLQLPLSSITKFKARGFFSDSPNSPRDIDPTKIALTWGKTVTTTSGDVRVVGEPSNTTGEYEATLGGPVTLTVSMTNALQEPNATPRTLNANVTVIEPICREQFFASNGTSSTVSSSDVTNAGNVIDADQNTFGTITLTPGALLGNGDQSMSFQRTGTVITPTTTPAQTAGFIIAYDEDVFSPDSLASIQTLNAQGTVVQDLAVSSSQLSSIPQRNNETLVAVKINPTMPFTGMRLTVTAPDPEATVPIPVLGDLLALLLGGGDTDVHVYALCSSFSN